ncbi:thiamine-phosphate kinase [Marinibactrum halimedae]|uniref:Thiamine-monophosphate kinase n=1 Tax=Marinibactrum halimedae TaxID=1444977 RepID=A0AA37T6G9_9GAMM|nr:thiamine-phosphate kinase [Marinibactrum halimedae]MCD9460522.1 thiamine-phosphate kinase [Marinibactrum halimedae]GLS27885.1 thiamine-monophosphate kinase [Marinibactrum halimedae]
MSVGEFQLIQEYFAKELSAFGVNLGIGDDCALLTVPEGRQLAVSMDTLVGGVHFPKNADPELIAERAVRVCVSDLAAMGAEPLWFTLGLTMPSSESNWLSGFSRGLFKAASEYNISLVGGDTTSGPLAITLQVHGSVLPDKALQRCNARVGDVIFVTGNLGDGAAALAVIKKEFEVGKSAFAYLMSRYYTPKARIREGQLLTKIGHAAIDVSDGLLADLGHICKASGVAAVIEAERLPISDPVKKLCDPDTAMTWALTGGDDYELCFTIPPSRLRVFEDLQAKYNFDCTAIGEIVSGDGVSCLSEGRVVLPPKSAGYEHF